MEIGSGNLVKALVLASGEKHLFEFDAKGRLAKTQTPAGTVAFGYDEIGNLVEDKRGGKGVAHEFDFNGLRRTTYLDKFQVNYQRARNRDLVVEVPTGATHRFEFGRTGLILKHLANGTRELCQYDPEGHCRRKALMRGNGLSLWMHGYSYSAAGDLVVVADTNKGTTRYRHDAAHRILEEARPDGVTRRFEHDWAGNVLKQPGLNGVVIGQANRLKEANGDLCAYTIRGHLSERRNGSLPTRYTYDDVDMLVRCDLRGEPWTASYDGLNRRVQKTWRAETTTYYWDDWRLAAEVRHNGSVRLYVYADDKALAPFLFVEYENLDAAAGSGKRSMSSPTRWRRPSASMMTPGEPSGPRRSARTERPRLTLQAPLTCRYGIPVTISTRRQVSTTTGIAITVQNLALSTNEPRRSCRRNQFIRVPYETSEDCRH